MNTRILPASLAMALLAAAQLARAGTYTVTSTGTGGACTANSSTDPACTLAAAIGAAVNGDDIAFAPDVQGQTIFGSYDMTKALSIHAEPNGIVLDGGGLATVFHIESVASVTLSHLTVQHGQAAASGGGFLIEDHGTLNLDRCTVAHNGASTLGGGIYNSGYLWINDSTLYDNAAATGGAIYSPAPFGSIVAVNSTIAGNNASSAAGGIYSSSAVILRSTIVAGNVAPAAPDIDNEALPSSVLVSYGNNLVGDGTGANFDSPPPSDQIGTAAAPIDPLFSPDGLADNGGAAQTVALRSASPARISGACSASSGPPHLDASTVDERDVPRSDPCTIGAFDMTAIFYGGIDGP